MAYGIRIAITVVRLLGRAFTFAHGSAKFIVVLNRFKFPVRGTFSHFAFCDKALHKCRSATLMHAAILCLRTKSNLQLFCAQVTSRALRSSVRPFTPAPVRAPRVLVVSVSALERLRLHNLTPEPGSRRDAKRKGRGHAAGQVRASFLRRCSIGRLRAS